MATASKEDLGRLIPVEHLPKPSVSIDNGEVSPVMFEQSWMDPIWDYLVDGTLTGDLKRRPNSKKGRKDSSVIGGPFINEASLHPFLSA